MVNLLSVNLLLVMYILLVMTALREMTLLRVMRFFILSGLIEKLLVLIEALATILRSAELEDDSRELIAGKLELVHHAAQPDILIRLVPDSTEDHGSIGRLLALILHRQLGQQCIGSLQVESHRCCHADHVEHEQRGVNARTFVVGCRADMTL